MTSQAELVRQAEGRAGQRCEYCRMHQALQGATFHLEHILPSSRGGSTDLDNLAWACPGCNLHKSDRTEALDPDTAVVVRLFNPRTDSWSEHFELQGYQIVGRTPVGRATVRLLGLNHPRRVLIRQAEEVFHLFPP
ncbi:MAG TPA: HNH endonuclease [Gemmataceae bacterium]|nr:HNH endonuclease [Gemmataceae bacterium]